MAYALLLAFVAVPIIEIAIFIQVGGLIGLFPTLLIVLATAVAGTALLRSQGFRTLQSARSTLDRGGFPARELYLNDPSEVPEDEQLTEVQWPFG